MPYLLLASAADDLVFRASGVRFLSAADVPMMVGTDNCRFCGTTVSRRLDGIFALNAEGTAFEPADTPTQVDAFRAYFTAPAALTPFPRPHSLQGLRSSANRHRPQTIPPSTTSVAVELPVASTPLPKASTFRTTRRCSSGVEPCPLGGDMISCKNVCISQVFLRTLQQASNYSKPF